MKFLFIFALLFSLNAWADGPIPGTGVAGSLITNPGTAAVLVTTPALTSGGPGASANWVIVVQYYCSANALLDIQTMNTVPAVVAHTFVPCNVLSGGIGGGGVFNVTDIAFAIPQSFKLQVVNVNSVTGNVQASVYYALQSVN